MNGNDAFDLQACKEDTAVLGSTTPRIVMHRLAEIRREKGMQHQYWPDGWASPYRNLG